MSRRVKGTWDVRHFVITGIILCVSVFCFTGFVHAQDLDLKTFNPQLTWTPDDVYSWKENPSYHYGNVIVGESRTVTFDLYSVGGSAVWLYLAWLNATQSDDYATSAYPYFDQYTLGAFSFNPGGEIWSNLPSEMPAGMHHFIDVLFTPTSAGDYSVYLGIFGNDSVGPEGQLIYVHLTGTAVAASLPEHTTLLLLGFGLLGLAVVGRILQGNREGRR